MDYNEFRKIVQDQLSPERQFKVKMDKEKNVLF